jgi:hypothetical protein
MLALFYAVLRCIPPLSLIVTLGYPLSNSVQRCPALSCTVLHCPALSCTVLHCPALTYLRSSARTLDSTVKVYWMRCSRMWMRCSGVARASDSLCRSRNCPGFDPSILRHSGIWGRQMKQCWIKYIQKNIQKNTPAKFTVFVTHQNIANGFSVDSK